MPFSKNLYFIALLPPQEIREELSQLQLEIKEKYKSSHALKLPAHITFLPPVWLKNDQEQLFFDTIKFITDRTVPFPVELKNYGRFGQRVIFINVLNHDLIKELHQKLITSLNSLIPGRVGNLHPHVTLARRDLSRQNFGKAWKEFENRSYSAEFKATSLTVFRHNGKTWDTNRIFSFLEKDDQ